MKPPPSLWKSLARELRVRRAPRRSTQRRYFDAGQPIDLRYDAGYHRPAAPAASLMLSLGTPSRDALTRPFTDAAPGRVESFEEEEAIEEGPAWGTGELEEELEAAEDGGAAAPPPVASVRAQSGVPEPALEIPVWGTGELESLEEAAGEPAVPQSRSRPGTRPATPGAPRALPNTAPTDDPDTAAFQADLAAILSGRKTHPSTAPAGTPDPAENGDEDEAAAPAPAAPAPPGPATATSFSHDVFEKLGHPLSTAQTFDLGSFALSRQLDAFDRELDRAERRSRDRRRAASAGRPAAEARLARAATTPVDVRHDVPLVPQMTNMSCWAAGCAMLVAWRDRLSVDPSEIAAATGAWAQYAQGLLPEDASVFPIWGLVPEPAQSYTVEGFADLLRRHGPLWVASAVPSPHIRVVTGMVGDGTPDGTTLYINDPWEQGMTTFRLPNTGSRTTETYAEFVRKQESLARNESNVQGIYVVRCARPRS